MGEYALRLPGGELAGDCAGILRDPPPLGRGLMRTEYRAARLAVRDMPGMYRFYDWLPVRSVIGTDASPVAFRSERLSRELGVRDLWIGFTGYHPERGAFAKSCSFKELEALPTYSRIGDLGGGTVALASAGNTARAFAQVSGETGRRCVIFVPEGSAGRVRATGDGGYARLFEVRGDYADAIRMAERAASAGGLIPEGGARNVARRDGMGTVLLEGALAMGRLPDRYFQAVGSGTGAISAWEASMRLIGDGRFGDRLPELDLSQNLSFAPMKRAWEAGRREISGEDLETPGAGGAYADVLANRRPPYGAAGGVFDAMSACGGRFYGVSEAEARSAGKLWSSMESASLDPAACVALASLIRAAGDGGISEGERVFLNLTGGGADRAEEDLDLVKIKPEARLGGGETDEEMRRILNE
ncbi:MAG: cysteate synthase [Candidatus Methanoplasma sp.]|jgi:cysteate synthase|nr:cysteate synthase [Candidatus Methanoplasma sp.]